MNDIFVYIAFFGQVNIEETGPKTNKKTRKNGYDL